MPLKPFTSDSITLAIAQTAALSLADETRLPVEISDWVVVMLELIPFRVCSATIAPVLVRIEVMFISLCDGSALCARH